MAEPRILVAFANQAGSTAGIAGVVAATLRRAGFAADCRLASEVDDLGPYAAVIIGSGVFVPSRRSDGGGFLTRHAGALASRRVWLFSAGPIGRGRCHGASGEDEEDCTVTAVARAINARGAAVFGPIGLPADADPMESMGPLNHERVRTWATEIAADLREASVPVAGGRTQMLRCRPMVARG
jgi:hypothetical protein